MSNANLSTDLQMLIKDPLCILCFLMTSSTKKKKKYYFKEAFNHLRGKKDFGLPVTQHTENSSPELFSINKSPWAHNQESLIWFIIAKKKDFTNKR